VTQEWFLTNVTSRFVVNQTVVWSQPRREAWTHSAVGNWSFDYFMRILWLPGMDYLPGSATVERPFHYLVNITVTVQKLDALCNTIHWEVSAVDGYVGVLFDKVGTLSSWNQTARVSQRLHFETPVYYVDGDGYIPSPYDLIFYGAVLLCICLYGVGRWAHRRWRRTHEPKRC
jgi:hypothetical protein